MRIFKSLFLLLALAFAAPLSAMLPDPAETAPDAIEAPAAGSIELDPAANADARIAGRLEDIFANVPSLANVEVAANEGVVTLTGTVPDQAAQERAEAIAAGVEGVATVENAIERDVSADLGAQVGGLQEMLADFWALLPLLGIALAVAIGIALIGYLLSRLTAIWHWLAPNSFLAELIASAIRFIFVVLGAVVALDMIGAGALMGAVLGGAGVIGIALGFAMRDTIENYVASLMLSLRQPFRANDHVVIDTHEGRVIRLTSRATVLMTLDGNHLRIPNSTVFKAVILNYTRNPQRRFDFVLGVDADDDPQAARVLGRETMGSLDFVLNDPPPEVRITKVGDSNVELQFLGWIDQNEADWHKARSRAIVAAKAALEEAGFALPEPIYRLRFDQRTGVLPFENVGEAGAQSEAKPAPAPAPAPKPAKTALVSDDVTPEDEIARMVDAERAAPAPETERDLLDSNRPVE